MDVVGMMRNINQILGTSHRQADAKGKAQTCIESKGHTTKKEADGSHTCKEQASTC